MRVFIWTVLIMAVVAIPVSSSFADEPPASIRTAAEKGETVAQFELAEFYFRTEANKDLTKARHWYRRAAQGGHAKGQALFAYFLDNGLGGEADFQSALVWYEKAVARGQHMAEYNLGLIYETGRGVERDIERAVRLYKAATQDVRYSLPQFRIGQIYETGALGKPDIAKAMEWYAYAAERGYTPAQERLKLLAEREVEKGDVGVILMQCRDKSLPPFDRIDACTSVIGDDEATENEIGKALVSRAITRKQVGEFGAAIRDYTRIVTMRPEASSAFYNRGNIHQTIGNFDLALSDYNETIRLQPDHAKAFANRGILFEKLDRESDAARDFQHAYDLGLREDLLQKKMSAHGLKYDVEYE